MPNFSSILLYLGIFMAAGCASRVPLLSLPENKRTGLFLSPNLHQPSIWTGSSEAPPVTPGQLLVYAVAGRATNDFGANREKIGTFEVELIRRKVLEALARNGISLVSTGTNGNAFELKMVTVGLHDKEPKRFTPYAHVRAYISDPTGQNLWKTWVESSGLKSFPASAFRDNPNLYRDQFELVAQDIAHQLVEGPIRKF